MLPPTQLITPSTASEGLGVGDPGPPVARRDTKTGWHREAHPTSALYHELGETRVNFYRLGVREP